MKMYSPTGDAVDVAKEQRQKFLDLGYTKTPPSETKNKETSEKAPVTSEKDAALKAKIAAAAKKSSK